MQLLRLYDPDRRPPNWTDIIRPGQFAAFARHVEGGGPCDADGRPFASSDLVTCLIFDELDYAARFCEERVTEVPSVRFEVFDSAGGRAGLIGERSVFLSSDESSVSRLPPVSRIRWYGGRTLRSDA
jgi:hypothetical protein